MSRGRRVGRAGLGRFDKGEDRHNKNQDQKQREDNAKLFDMSLLESVLGRYYTKNPPVGGFLDLRLPLPPMAGVAMTRVRCW